MPKPADLPAPVRRQKKGAEPPADRSRQPPPEPAMPKTKGLTIKLDERQYRRLRLMAVDTGLTHQDICESAIIAALDEHERGKG